MRASFSSETTSALATLIRGDFPRVTRKATILDGEGELEAGTVLGLVVVAGASVQAGGSNTGNGTLTLDGTTPVLAGAKAGVYRVTCITAATNAGTFRVEDPDGFVLGDVAVGGTFSDDIKFAIADGGTDFVVGDLFEVTVAAGSLKYRVAASANRDGSAVPEAVLAEDVDASDGDVEAIIYLSGDFHADALTFGSGVTAAAARPVLRAKSIFI